MRGSTSTSSISGELSPADNIRAFQTITTLLASVSKRRDRQIQVRTNSSKGADAAHKVANAIATLAVRLNEDIAIALVHENPLRPEVVICASTNDAQSTSRKNVAGITWWPWRTLNNLFGSIPSNNNTWNGPALQETTIPGQGVTGVIFRETEDVFLLDYFEYLWNIELSLKDHLWMLTKILNTFMHDKMLVHRLLIYVLAACCKKVKQRLENRKVSKPYLDQLLDRKVNLERQRFNDSYQTTDDLESHYDARLATIINTKSPILDKYPLLKAVALEHKQRISNYGIKEARQSLQLYNSETFKEFYSLFLAYLRDFKEGMDFLCQAQASPGNVDRDEYLDKLALLCNTVRALQAFARGSALKKHLQFNEYLLCCKDNTRALGFQDHDVDATDEECDEELEAVAADCGQINLSDSYIQWLKLILVQVDAVDILARNVQSFAKGTIFSTKLLVPPPVDKHLMAWPTLLLHDSIFDDQNVSYIVTSLQEAINLLNLPVPSKDKGTEKHLKSIQGLIRCLYNSWVVSGDPLSANSLGQAVSDVEKLEQILDATPKLANFRGWDVTVKLLLKDLLHLQKVNISDVVALNRATRCLIRLTETVNLFLAFERTDTAQSTFKGRIHSQVFLADYIYSLDYTGKSFRPVLGIPKLCCPACEKFLEHMATVQDVQKFTTRGSHSVINACTLPAETPQSVVGAMNRHFGRVLIEEIKKILPDKTFSSEHSAFSTSDSLDIVQDA